MKMKPKPWGYFLFLIPIVLTVGWSMKQTEQKHQPSKPETVNPNYQTAIFAGGCFWCMQPPYVNLPGVISTTVGYTGGKVENPTYEEVCTGETGHAEAVKIFFDSSKINYRDLLDVFWHNIDPTNPFGQFADRGSQYRTAIFYFNEKQKELAEQSKKALAESGKFDQPIVTKIVPASAFYPAENYHQEFYKKNPLRYEGYKVGSGRAGYLKEKWGDQKK